MILQVTRHVKIAMSDLQKYHWTLTHKSNQNVEDNVVFLSQKVFRSDNFLIKRKFV